MIQFTTEAYGVLALQLYDEAACAAMVRRLDEEDGWMGATVRQWKGRQEYQNVSRPEVRAANVLSGRRAASMIKEFDRRMERVVKPLVREVWGAHLTEHAGTQIIRYTPGGHYAVHSDAARDLQYRYFSVLCYLNDDFEGGETGFPSLGYDARPQSGKAIIFPSRYLHCGKPVGGGVKYVLLTWITGPLPIDWMRD